MSSVTLDERQIKDLFKQAVLELFQERRDLLYDLLAEVIEDFALANAIRQGESTEILEFCDNLTSGTMCGTTCAPAYQEVRDADAYRPVSECRR